MWHYQCETFRNGDIEHVSIFCDRSPISYRDFIGGLCDSQAFRSFYNGVMADSQLAAFRWETPPVTRAALDREFEFVRLRCDALDRHVDRDSFHAYFNADCEVVTFANLGRDAVMVVPCPMGDVTKYAHLGAFVRHASDSQQHALWREVGIAMRRRVSSRPVWLNTAGMGVAWLHIRLDDRPKYYGYAPYRTEDLTGYCET